MCGEGTSGGSVGDFGGFLPGDRVLYSEDEGKEIPGESIPSVAYRGERGIGGVEGNDGAGYGGIEAGWAFGCYYLSFPGRQDCEKLSENGKYGGVCKAGFALRTGGA